MMHEGAEDIVFRLLCCVVHCLVQDHCIGVHNGLFIVTAWWCILDCSVQVQSRGKQEGAMDRVFKSLCCVLHYLVQNFCIGVHNGLLMVTAWWCILVCSV